MNKLLEVSNLIQCGIKSENINQQELFSIICNEVVLTLSYHESSCLVLSEMGVHRLNSVSQKADGTCTSTNVKGT